MTQRKHYKSILLSSLLLVTACGGTGESKSAGCSLCGDLNDITGSIRSKTGSQAQMQGWVVAAFEHDTGIARVSDVDLAGLYTLRKVRTDVTQTLALLTPDYILTAVLSVPGTVDKTIRQFIKMDRPTLPLMINNGPIITFQNFDGITVKKDAASDQDGDGIPDGSVSLGASGGAGLTDDLGENLAGFNLQTASTVPQNIDTDKDGVPNSRDPDIDGDGIINVLDPDDNGNGILDVFDGDANGDLANDTAPGANNTDLYFTQGVEYIAVQFDMSPKDDGSGNETTLKFTAKVRDEVTPDAVQIRGAPSLLNNATYIAKDNTGADSIQAWNRQLFDDGLSEDANPGDRTFAKRVTLADAKAPRAHEAVFFQLVFGGKAPYYVEFPYVFPDLKPAAITAQYESTSKTVLLIGNPFGNDIQDFIWTINVYDDTGHNIWQSKPIVGSTRQFAIQDNILEKGKAYKFSVAAQTLDKIQGYPAYTINSIKYDVH